MKEIIIAMNLKECGKEYILKYIYIYEDTFFRKEERYRIQNHKGKYKLHLESSSNLCRGLLIAKRCMPKQSLQKIIACNWVTFLIPII